MKLLKNRKIAILIAVVVMIFTMLFGVHRSLNRLAGDVEEMFYEGVPIEGTDGTWPSISQHLGNLTQSILDTSSLFANHADLSGEAEALTYARRSFMDADSISDKYSAYQDIQSASTLFINKAETLDLSERELVAFIDFQTVFRGASIAIQNSEYNARARGFMDEASFITVLLKPFIFVTAPQVFD